MAYNNYSQSGGNGYGRTNPYEQSNPYQQPQSNPYGQQQGNPYGAPPRQQQQQSPYSSQQDRYGEKQDPYDRQPQRPVEMQNIQQEPYGGNQAPYAARMQQDGAGDQHAILNECRDIQRAIDDLEGDLQQMQRAQRSFVAGNGASNRDIDAMSADIMGTYRSLADRVKRIKSRPEAGNPQNAPQVGNLDRRIKKAINAYQQQESAFRKEVQEQQKRQYLIVNPNATDSELRDVAESSGDVQVFQQALLNSNRRGQAQSTLANVRQRHDAIQNIERTMTELMEMFQDLDAIVTQQDEVIAQVEKGAEDTQTHMVEANVQLEQATVKARSARKKKWICLGICIAIIVVVAAVVVIYGATQGWFKKSSTSSKKRAVDFASAAFVSGRDEIAAAAAMLQRRGGGARRALGR